MAGSRTILIIDEVPIFREIGAAFLARSGRVLTAGSARDGLALARRVRPDVVIADLLTEGDDGRCVCAAIRSDPELSGIRVLVLLSGDVGGDHAHAIRAGADDVLRKPINRIELSDAVRRLLRDPVQGAPRVSLCEPVRILETPEVVSWGRACNLSHGGVFVEADHPLPPDAEVWLQFRLPDGEPSLFTSAKVNWRREDVGMDRRGMGLRFLAIDRCTARRVDDFVYERAERPPPPPMDAAP